MKSLFKSISSFALRRLETPIFGLIRVHLRPPVFRPTLGPWHSRGVVAILLFTGIFLGVSVPRASATDIEGVSFAGQYQTEGVRLQLECVGLLRYKIFFKGYVAGLYLPPEVRAEEVLDDVPKRLELSYFWSIGASDFGKVGDEILARNVDGETVERLRPRLDRINGLYQDVKPGDRYSLTYIPGEGTELALNGERRGVIPGADFAKAYFSIWLGREPIDVSLKQQLLNCT